MGRGINTPLNETDITLRLRVLAAGDAEILAELRFIDDLPPPEQARSRTQLPEPFP